MRRTVFRRLMAAEFGEVRAETLAADYVLGRLDGRTVDQALADGVPAKQVWRAVCAEFEVPLDRQEI
ncbi:Protein of unknown function [Haloechinothrix alba]|uniref:DUF3046 domain-containing protein n=2 Tax=Haloechinothrix TaxID=1425377 RepID=A0A238X4W2_9PSEU|nr:MULTISPECIES: DUF3046 domain-containing protein [Haloechinothrix]MBA0125669.1 DUF3046 domain-containing protein [Haloechinothrix aidingensis]SNR53672.1 Protein of unknown function [Haloechinothrix alba]